MVDEVHERTDAASRAFNRHIEQFQEGVDYFRVPYPVWSQIVVVKNVHHQPAGTEATASC
jgi:hypothetical protein